MMVTAMKRSALLLVIIVLTSLAFWPLTNAHGDGQTAGVTEVLGMPVLGVGSDRFCWLSIGMGTGVLFVGFIGGGGVAIALAAGVGVLFGMGQAAAGMIVVGQLALGLVFALGQLATGATGLGQLIGGALVKGQVGIGKDGGAFLGVLQEDLERLLSFRGGGGRR
jgi:hypothetical protein